MEAASTISKLPDKSQFRLGYMPFLDGMRGFGILLFMAWHADAPYLRGSFVYLNVFFVLSGFLITSLLIKEWDRHGEISLGKFYARRALRLLPALVVMLTLYVAASFFLLSNPFDHFVDALLVLFYASNWTRAFGLDRPSLLGHAWSLSIEEQFYLLWPVILILMLRFMPSPRRMLAFAVLGIVLITAYRIDMAAAGATIERLYNGFDTRGDSLLLGCALGIVLSSNLIRASAPTLQITRILSFIGAAGMLAIFQFADWRELSTYYYMLSLCDIFSTLIILDMVLSPSPGIVKRLFEAPLFVWTGKISYGLYIWHFPIFRALQIKLGWDWYLVLAVGGAMTFAVASASYYLLERPFLRMKTRFG
ncbi:MAG: acyltransferase family protein [Deltaproteobacteria bacterium]